MNPVMSQTAMSHPALPVLRAMSALTMNIPEPIMLPATSMVASISPNDDLNPLLVVLIAIDLVVEVIKLPCRLIISCQLLVGKGSPNHFHGQVILLDNVILEFLIGHLSAVYQFILDAEQLETADEISQLVQRTVIGLKRPFHLAMCIRILMANAVYQVIDTLLGRPLTQVELYGE